MINKRIIENVALETYRNHDTTFLPLKERWTDLLNRYENKLRAGSITANTTSKIRLGGAYALVENAIVRMINRQPKYSYLATERKDGEVAELYNEFSEYQWNESCAQAKMKIIARWGLVAGLSGWVMGWKEETKIYKKKTKKIAGIEVKNKILEPFAKTEYKDVEDTVCNYTITPKKPHDLIWSVESTELEDCRVIGYKDKALIKQLKQLGYKTESLTASVKSSEYWQERIAQNDGISTYRENKELDNVEVDFAQLYVRLLNDEGYYEYYVVTLGCYNDNPVVIGLEENKLDRKFAPMGIFRPIDRLGKFYGFGMIEPVQGILDAEEDTLNMAIEALWTDVSRPMEYVASNLLKPNSIKYAPRTLIPVKILGQSVKVMDTPTPNMNGVQYVNDYLNRSKQNVSSITDFQTGSEQLQGNKTLGEIQIKTQESNARIAGIMDNFEKQVLEPIGKFALYFNQQFLAENPKIIYRVTGKKGNITEKTIRFKDVEAIKDVMVVSGKTMLASQQENISKWSLLLNQAYMEEKSMAPVSINKETIWERLLEEGVQVNDIENFLPNAKEAEEGAVQGGVAQIEDAKSENANPLTARVLPTDVAEIHIPLHQAGINKRQQELEQAQSQGMDQQMMDRGVQELQILIQHLNDHTQVAGGPVPPYSGGMEVGSSNEATSTQPTQGAIGPGPATGGAVPM